MIVTAIIQARMGSTRLPGKVMVKIEGKPLLCHVIKRVEDSKQIMQIIVATTNLPEDDIIEAFCNKIGIECYRGSSDDVLDHFYRAALKYGADVVVRITADCPLIDPKIIDKAVGLFLKSDADYLSNTLKPTYPDGVDVEVFSFKALERAWKEAKLASEREHVTPYIIKNSHIFNLINLKNERDLSSYRWTVDEERDLIFVREIYKRLYRNKNTIFYMEDILSVLNKEPHLVKINEGIKRNEGYIKSLIADKLVNKNYMVE